MFQVMPPHLQELDLAGFSWTSAAKALAVAQQPNLQRLLLNLESKPGARMAPAKLTAHFPALVHIHIPARWCAQPSWFMQAFEGSKLEHIAVGFTDCVRSAEPDDHLCNVPCRWIVGLDRLFAASSSSLTTMTISTDSFPSGSLVSFIERVTTVTFRSIDFDWDEELLDELVGPFATLSITGLHFVDCSGIPPAFGRWFEDTEPSRQCFPALKELKAGQLYTQADGEDDDEWDPEGDIIFEGEDVWQPEERRTFEKDCERRGIDAVFHWDWFDGWD
ncbi:hypothetical protein BDZ89DRAFT_1056553 [Hymenopellis radicata]|nr:hypothetical protein BDZ89DRAFT_1056553 [Hymenopellis radicata]